jgi:geranylgeranyl diphosphate synthase type II
MSDALHEREPPSSSGLDDLLPLVEQSLDEAIVAETGCPPVLTEAMRYALLAPGKRLRPALVLMACEACGGALRDALPAAVAVEMVHAYSLIHDDLPAMDDDAVRRGRPTCHIRFGEANAILAGDALLTRAFAVLAGATGSPERARRSVAVLAVAAGSAALVGGQVDDLAAETDGVHSVERLESIHRRKTGALFSASLELGGIAADATESQLASLRQYAASLGLAFQVVDDLLDHLGEAGSLQKNAGQDAERGKLTYPGLLGVEGARSRAEELIAAAQDSAGLFETAGWRLKWLADFVIQRIQ